MTFVNPHADQTVEALLKTDPKLSISINELIKSESIDEGGFGCITKAIWTKSYMARCVLLSTNRVANENPAAT